MTSKEIHFFFGYNLDQETSCQNFVNVYEDRKSVLRSYLNMNIGTIDKPRFISCDKPTVDLLGFFLK